LKICWNFKLATEPNAQRTKQAPKTNLLSLEMDSTWRQSRAEQVITFMGTLNQFITFALCDSGMTWLRRYEIDGKYIPMPISNNRNARNETSVMIGLASGAAVMQQTPILTLIIAKTSLKMLASVQPLLLRMENIAEPTMMQTMKQLNTIPSGVEPVSSTGVQRKTKIYMQDSRRDWQQPRRRT